MDAKPGLRAATDRDIELLARIYTSTRREEMAATGWGREQVETFLRLQFEAQHRYYRETFPNASFDIVELAGNPIGRLYVDRRPDGIRVVDIALLPEYRERGIGTRLLKAILREAAECHVPVRIHVERHNRARSLYVALGFRQIEDKGIYLHMEWAPQPRGDDRSPVGRQQQGCNRES